MRMMNMVFIIQVQERGISLMLMVIMGRALLMILTTCMNHVE